MKLKQQFDYITAGHPRRLVKPVLWAVYNDLIQMVPFGVLALIVMSIYTHFALLQGASADALSFPPIELELLWFAWGGMAVCLVLLFIGEVMLVRTGYRGAYLATADGRIAMAEHMRKLPLGTLTRQDPGALGNIMMEDFTLIENAVTHILPSLVAGVIAPVLAFLGFLFIDWRMAVATFAALPLTFAVIALVQNLGDRLMQDNVEARAQSSSQLQEYLFGMKVIKAYNLVGANFKSLEAAFSRLRHTSIKQEGALGPFFLMAIALLKAGLPLIILLGIYLLLGGDLDVGIFALFLLMGTRIFDPLTAAIMRYAEYRYDLKAGKRIMDLLDMPIMQGDKPVPQAHDVALENVSFRYRDTDVLKGVSLQIPAQTLTALVGPSGSGKSTLLKLVARFYDPQAGTVRFGGVDERELDPEALMGRISMVFQDVYLFNDTIGNNIRYGRNDATQAQIEAAARAAQCHSFIQALPLGYDTMVGEGGSTLSGGEKQRVSIARALLKDAPVVLLDEATSSLDPENERDVQRAINRLAQGRTVIMIAHRLKTVTQADNIVVLEDGRITEQGTHEELLAKGSLYARMWTLQKKSLAWKMSR
jgi:ATP-binding cassette subfamily B protein